MYFAFALKMLPLTCICSSHGKITISLHCKTNLTNAIRSKCEAITKTCLCNNFHGYKNGYFQLKYLDIFLIFAQNIECEAVLTSTPIYVLE